MTGDNMERVFARLSDHAAPVGVVGLGYVGLPLACLLAKKFKVVGFDIKAKRVEELTNGHDRTGEVEDKAVLLNPNLAYTADPQRLGECPLIIIAVPTPVDGFKVPDLGPVISASKTVGSVVAKGSTIVFESTVYPGVTDGVCAETIAKQRGLVPGVDFHLGYSPERVNPGDKRHTIDKITKVVSGSTPEVTELLAKVYGSVITAGVFRAASIRTAEAAKVIENIQRDLNIALVNELSMLFDRIGLDTLDVLEASGTKWNFLPFRPGLVGGPCIGVDPYYLTHLAEGVGFHTQVISAGRRINDGMGPFVAQKCVSMLLSSKTPAHGGRPRVAILGVTFKENLPDVRNTKVVDVADALAGFGVDSYLMDPVADADDFHEEYRRELVQWDQIPPCDAIVLAVKHDIILKEFPLERLAEKLRGAKLVLDLKGALDRQRAVELGLKLWRM
jgi:UDP-N-acetyl-D-galactosamine dehydrogenase